MSQEPPSKLTIDYQGRGRQTHSPLETYERYSDDIRQVLVLANNEALRHWRTEIAPVHVLIAMTRENTGLGGFLLRKNGIFTKPLRREVRRILARGWSLQFGIKLPMADELKDYVVAAVRLALNEGHDSVGTGGVLLALVAIDPMVRQTLNAMHLEVGAFEIELKRLLRRFMVEAPGQPLEL